LPPESSFGFVPVLDAAARTGVFFAAVFLGLPADDLVAALRGLAACVVRLVAAFFVAFVDFLDVLAAIALTPNVHPNGFRRLLRGMPHDAAIAR
jgi:hypothetical protein